MSLKKYAMVTVCDSDFIIGTRVLFYSFLKHNPWFTGDLVIIQNKLGSNEKDQLSKFKNVRFEPVGNQLQSRINWLNLINKKYLNSGSRFFSLEAFRLDQYDKILFLDSDMLCTGCVKSLFEYGESSFLASPDRQYYRGLQRDMVSFLPCKKMKKKLSERCADIFNSGMMLVDHNELSQTTYQSLLKYVDPEFYSDIKTGHTDQYLLNHYFQQKVKLVSYKFNYLLVNRDEIDQKENTSIENALLLHFVGKYKPWDGNPPSSNYVEGYNLWRNDFEELQLVQGL